MEIRDSIIMLHDIFPDCNTVIVLTVKCTIDEFHLRNIMVQEKLQFLLYQFYISEPQALVYRRQTVAAGKWTASACLIIDNFVFKIFYVVVDRRNLT